MPLLTCLLSKDTAVRASDGSAHLQVCCPLLVLTDSTSLTPESPNDRQTEKHTLTHVEVKFKYLSSEKFTTPSQPYSDDSSLFTFSKAGV